MFQTLNGSGSGESGSGRPALRARSFPSRGRMKSSADCLFCKIAARQIPSNIVYETPQVLGFKDVNPQAPVHVLFIPKEHLSGLQDITETNQGAVPPLILAANKIAGEFKVAESGYRLVINCRKEGGQTVDHLHVHLLGGRRMTWPPG